MILLWFDLIHVLVRQVAAFTCMHGIALDNMRAARARLRFAGWHASRGPFCRRLWWM